MEIDIIELSDRKARFVLSGVSESFANAIRRSILSEVPMLAIDDVKIYDNTSVLFDEQLALRLGLIPLKADTSTYSFPNECECKGVGCSLCQVLFSVSADGPKIIRSGDMRSSDPDVCPADSTIPIVELKEKHKIMVEAIARLGTGKQHAKWQAGVASGYKNMPHIDMCECDDLDCNDCIDSCPRDILERIDNKIKVTDIIECSMCKQCEKVCDNIKVSEIPDSFVMTFETSGNVKALELGIEAVTSIKKRSNQLCEILESF